MELSVLNEIHFHLKLILGLVQKKLEQLLLKYPPEEVESRRWQKIADELGNRTAKQVMGRAACRLCMQMPSSGQFCCCTHRTATVALVCAGFTLISIACLYVD